MAFRHISYSVHLESKGEVRTLVKRPSSIDDNNTQIYSVVAVDDDTLNANVPASSDYTLEKLIAAGLPLNYVGVTLDSPEKQADSFLSENDKLNLDPSNTRSNEN